MSNGRPEGLFPHLFVSDAEAALRFYREAFGAVELFRNVGPGGLILFVELAVGEGRLLVSQEVPQLDALAPTTIGGSPVLLTLEVPDPDGVFTQALEAGAEVEQALEERFWGERYGIVRDPSGHRWAVTTARQELTPDDIARGTPPHV